MRISKIEFRLLSLVYKSSHYLNAFTVYRKLKLSFSEFINAFNKLLEKEFIESIDKKIHITAKGNKFLLEKKNNYLILVEKIWRKVPSEFTQNCIESNEFYVPRKTLLDSRQFKNK